MGARFPLLLAGGAAAGLALLRLVAPGRPDWIAAALCGAAFGFFAAVAGREVVRRAAARSDEAAVRAFLAVMTGKVVAFAAFLLTIALTTTLNLPWLAAGLVIVTLAGEILVVTDLRRGLGPVGARAAGPEDARTGRRSQGQGRG